jgi:hypothetical protein
MSCSSLMCSAGRGTYLFSALSAAWFSAKAGSNMLFPNSCLSVSVCIEFTLRSRWTNREPACWTSGTNLKAWKLNLHISLCKGRPSSSSRLRRLSSPSSGLSVVPRLASPSTPLRPPTPLRHRPPPIRRQRLRWRHRRLAAPPHCQLTADPPPPTRRRRIRPPKPRPPPASPAVPFSTESEQQAGSNPRAIQVERGHALRSVRDLTRPRVSALQKVIDRG